MIPGKQTLECPECGDKIVIDVQENIKICERKVYDAWKAKWAQKQTCPVCKARMEYFRKTMEK